MKTTRNNKNKKSAEPIRRGRKRGQCVLAFCNDDVCTHCTCDGSCGRGHSPKSCGNRRYEKRANCNQCKVSYYTLTKRMKRLSYASARLKRDELELEKRLKIVMNIGGVWDDVKETINEHTGDSAPTSSSSSEVDMTTLLASDSENKLFFCALKYCDNRSTEDRRNDTQGFFKSIDDEEDQSNSSSEVDLPKVLAVDSKNTMFDCVLKDRCNRYTEDRRSDTLRSFRCIEIDEEGMWDCLLEDTTSIFFKTTAKKTEGRTEKNGGDDFVMDPSRHGSSPRISAFDGALRGRDNECTEDRREDTLGSFRSIDDKEEEGLLCSLLDDMKSQESLKATEENILQSFLRNL
jgi:hypothetical protein